MLAEIMALFKPELGALIRPSEVVEGLAESAKPAEGRRRRNEKMTTACHSGYGQTNSAAASGCCGLFGLTGRSVSFLASQSLIPDR